jgi:hypothetical protein
MEIKKVKYAKKGSGNKYSAKRIASGINIRVI